MPYSRRKPVLKLTRIIEAFLAREVYLQVWLPTMFRHII